MKLSLLPASSFCAQNLLLSDFVVCVCVQGAGRSHRLREQNRLEQDWFAACLSFWWLYMLCLGYEAPISSVSTEYLYAQAFLWWFVVCTCCVWDTKLPSFARVHVFLFPCISLIVCCLYMLCLKYEPLHYAKAEYESVIWFLRVGLLLASDLVFWRDCRSQMILRPKSFCRDVMVKVSWKMLLIYKQSLRDEHNKGPLDSSILLQTISS